MVDRREVEDIKYALNQRAADLAQALLGEPNPKYSNRRELRFGNRGSISVVIAGPKTGLYCDHENGNGGDLFTLIEDSLGYRWPEAVDYARNFAGLTSQQYAVRRPERPPEDREAQRRAERDAQREKIKIAANIFRESTSPRGTIVERYLASRKLTLPDEIANTVLRFHPALLLDGRCRPAMVAVLRDLETNKGCGIHRTFLDEHERKIKPPKMLGRAGNAAIKLSPGDEVTRELCICEGIETGLAALLAGYRPIWALGSAGAIAKFPVLAGVGTLTILTERNDGGANARAVEEVAARWYAADREIIAVEMLVGDDLNDAWREAVA